MEKLKEMIMKDYQTKEDVDLLKTPMMNFLVNDDDGAVFGFAAEFVTQDKAAKMLGISTVTLRRYVRMGFITRFTVGRRNYYRRAEVEQAKQNIFHNSKH